MMVVQLCNAQSISYNQYNAVLSAVNPAYIANLEKDYVSLIGRNQWPGYAQSATMSTFAFNKSFSRINSSFGLVADGMQYNHGSYSRKSLGLQYAYKVMFLEEYLLDFGASVQYRQEDVVLNRFNDGFFPKGPADTLPALESKGQGFYLNYGCIFQPYHNRWYIGLSVRDQLLRKISPGDFARKPVLSVQLMKALPVTRYSSVFCFLGLEHNGKMAFAQGPVNGSGKSFYTLFFQANYLVNDKYSIGIGYKYFTGRYGSLHYRIGYTTGSFKNYSAKNNRHRFTIGLGYDVKPYIQNDHIHSFSSYEIFLKYKIPSKI
jgi:type IX secretion system PorP/SprF family membrane protein